MNAIDRLQLIGLGVGVSAAIVVVALAVGFLTSLASWGAVARGGLLVALVLMLAQIVRPGNQLTELGHPHAIHMDLSARKTGGIELAEMKPSRWHPEWLLAMLPVVAAILVVLSVG